MISGKLGKTPRIHHQHRQSIGRCWFQTLSMFTPLKFKGEDIQFDKIFGQNGTANNLDVLAMVMGPCRYRLLSFVGILTLPPSMVQWKRSYSKDDLSCRRDLLFLV